MIDRKNAQQMAEALVDKMTVDEMIGQLKFDAPAIERLHVPAYNWWNEGHPWSGESRNGYCVPTGNRYGGSLESGNDERSWKCDFR